MRKIVAPNYPPARAFHKPVPAPFEFGVRTVVIGELMETPVTREIVQQHARWATAMYQSPLFQPHRMNFTLTDMAGFLPGDFSKSVADVDAALKKLPRSEWPASVR